jgi:sugar (pentulose or hexulose) kinase
MPSARHVAVLDVGKSNAKLVLFDLQEDREIAARTMPNEVRKDGPYPHFDVDRIFDFALDALSDLTKHSPVDAISITTHGASAALLRGDGLALPVLDYEHDGPDRMAEAYDRVRPDFAETCSPRLPIGLNLGAQLHWQARTFPDRFAQADRIVTYPQYWAWRLCGLAATEVTSLGCHTDLWNPKERRFSSLVTRLGWERLVAPVRAAFDALGPVNADLARRVGLAPGTPVHCGLHDSNASLLPHLLRQPPPFTVVSTGTWVIVLGVGGALDGLDATRDTLANVDAFGRPVPSARFMGGREYDLLTGGAKAEMADADVRRVLERQTIVLPAIVPASGPFPKARGGWADGQEPGNAGGRAAAATLYLALMTDTCMELAGAAGPVAIEGPMARNTLYCQALAALSGRAVHATTGSTGTSAGAALLARGVQAPDAERPPAVPSVEPFRDVAGLQRYAATWKRLAGNAEGLGPARAGS